jgi:GNAT superfamily N-acetyltransferase
MSSEPVKIVPFEVSHSTDFYEINKQWISSMFEMEPIDEKILSNPQELIIDQGGYIWMAQHEQKGMVGTIALKKDGDALWELTKMGVLESVRGLKVGEKLLHVVIDFVRENKMDCFLLTNSACKAAIHLYEKNGFVHDPKVLQEADCDYIRCDVSMRLPLEKDKGVENGHT